MNYVWLRFPKHGFEVPEHSGNPIFLLNCLGAFRVDVADRNCLDQFRECLESWTVTFGDVSGAEESDAESPVWSYLA